MATSIAEFAAIRDRLVGTAAPPSIGFVPTMGALHDGHLSLIRVASSVSDAVVLSIFVNPLQFGPEEDYARYPRPLQADLEACERAGVDLVFVPTVSDLYPAGRQVTVSAGPMGAVFEGAFRPGHFDGVLTVVLKLFNIVAPDLAVFGQKDAQQLACIRRLVADLNVDVEIVCAPTVRDDDGLAISSRNRFLSPLERTHALALSGALRLGQQQSTPAAALAAADGLLRQAEAEGQLALDYVALVNPATMTPVTAGYAGTATLIVAARVGSTRLIDNAELEFAPVPVDA